MSQNAIELRGLQKTYAATKKSDAKIALSGIDLDIPRGKCVVFVGNSGAGKSTLTTSLTGKDIKTNVLSNNQGVHTR